MSQIAQNITDLIGNTPLLKLGKYSPLQGLSTPLLAKLEMFNPAGSVKDRVALSLILEAEKRGDLTPNATIIEPTSGNTGIGLASIGASRGYKVILTMPETMSLERRQLLKAYGAEIVLTEGPKGMAGAVEKAEQLGKEIPNSFLPGQFRNTDNPLIHERTTAPEIWEATNGSVDIFVAGIGTGGTITGVGRYLKKKNPNIKIVAIEPAQSPLLSKGVAGPHALQGIGANFVPEILEKDLIDEIITVSKEDAYATVKTLAKEEGILAGISAGAALFAATQFAKRPENDGKNIVVLLPDTGERYLSTGIFD